MNNKNNTRAITDAGILIALIVVINLMVSVIPILDLIGIIILPLPITLLYLRYDIRTTVIAIAASTIVTAIIIGPFAAVSSTLLYSGVGIALGFCVKKNKAASFTIGFMSIFVMIGYIAVMAITLTLIQKTSLYDQINQMIDMLKSSMNESIKLLNANSSNNQQTKILQDYINSLTPKLLMATIPGALIMYSIVMSLINYAFSKKILKRFKYNLNKLPSFDKFYIDNRIGALLIAMTAVSGILYKKNVPAGYYLFNSLWMILQLVLAVIGSAVIYYFLINRFKLHKGLSAVIVIFLALSQVFFIVILYLGFADMLFDFRKLDPNRLFNKRRIG
ncbi:DUF2232 domain-containing protein [Clostridium sp. 19966]|uniref:DUF2232 domain-containing protein n=1 Tax=Clostridium sp. 19966 TaxID=2768166 RepID=UPI0028DED5C2|nr:DUF2232 domain-containing protein [Clostridium sp. 19966]MDT8719302.1 DUF2232 domain-containing protein [Clostridium sp. 19966]